jgi:hypothetical protein
LTYILNSNRHTSILARSRPHSYRKTIGHRNRVRQNETQRKTTLDASKVTIEATTTLFTHNQFIEHLVDVTEKQP